MGRLHELISRAPARARTPRPYLILLGGDIVAAILVRTRHRMLLVFAGVAVAGLLSMHGLDSVVADLDRPTHASHSQPADPDHHSVISLCVFVVALTGLGLAVVRRIAAATRPARAPYRTAFSAPTPTPRASGPPLLHRLCVLRL
jgi:hypothetical protein